MFGSRLTQNSVPASVDVVNGTGGENNNLYFYTPNLASRLIGPASGGQANAEDPTFTAMLSAASDSDTSRLAPSPSDPSPLMSGMMADGESDISDFRMRAVMVFTYIGFAFLTIVLLGTFIVSMYWTLSGACSKQKDQQGKKKGQNGGCCFIEDAPRPTVPAQKNGSAISIGSSNNGSQKKPKRKTSPRSSKYNETGLIGDEESVNCELLEWDRQTQVIEMEDL